MEVSILFKSPIEYLKELLAEILGDFADMAFGWLKLFMLKPTNFEDYPKMQVVYDVCFTLATVLGSVFIAFALFKLIVQKVAQTEQRSIPEILTKYMIGFVLALISPWLLDNVLIKLNNAIVQYWLDKGLDTKMLEKFVVDGSATFVILCMALVIIILFVLLGMQYIQRIGEYMVLLVTAPIAAYSVITEDFDIWPIWWREAISVVFSQAFQVTLLWWVLNLITGTEKLQDYLFAIGLMVVILKGPKFLRQFLYSSGAGRAAAGAVGGTGKMAMYKYAASKIVK